MESAELKAELLMATKGYECEERRSWEEGIDFVASDTESDEKILLRVITETKSNSEVLGVDVVRQMAEILERNNYDRGVLFGEKFSEAAHSETDRKGILIVSKNFMPPIGYQELYPAIDNCIDDLCRAKCGQAPEKKTDCKGEDSEGSFFCKIRLISDNATFHFERRWTDLLKQDLMKLLRMRKSSSS